MTREEILEYYSRYSEDEIFYKEYFQAKGNHDALNVVTARLRADKGSLPNVWLPELNMRGAEHIVELIFEKADNNVNVLRHPRYNPLFVHSHDFFEIVYVFNGSCTNTIEKYSLTMNRGDLCIMAPGVQHSLGVFDDESIVLNIVVRSSTFKETFFDIFKDDAALSQFFMHCFYSEKKDMFLCYHTYNNDELETLLNVLFTESIEEKEYTLRVRENLLRAIFCLLLRETPEQVLLSRVECEPIDIVDVLRYIQVNYRTVTFKDLSEHCHLSQSYLRRLLRQHTGESYSNILRRVRMQRACLLLRTSNMQVTDIAESVGYESNEHFTRIFKQLYGVTPLGYRRLHEDEGEE